MSTIRIKIKKVMNKISLTIATKNDRTYVNIILRNWSFMHAVRYVTCRYHLLWLKEGVW